MLFRSVSYCTVSEVPLKVRSPFSSNAEFNQVFVLYLFPAVPAFKTGKLKLVSAACFIIYIYKDYDGQRIEAVQDQYIHRLQTYYMAMGIIIHSTLHICKLI